MENHCICPTCGHPHIKHERVVIAIIGVAADIPSTVMSVKDTFKPEPIKLEAPIIEIPTVVAYSYEEHKRKKSRTNRHKFNGF
jgi:hypothetical protein